MGRDQRFELIDGLRGLAACTVVLCHAILLLDVQRGGLHAFGERIGPFGLCLLFLISGFVLYRPLIVDRCRGRTRSWRTWFARRAVRIVPGYWAALTLMAIWPGLNGIFTGDFWVYYGFLQIYDVDTSGLGLGPAWSLCVECTFYLALPLYALVMRRAGVGAARHGLRNELLALAVLGAGSLYFRGVVLSGVESTFWFLTLPSVFTWFAAGMAFAALTVAGGPALERARGLARHPVLCWAATLVLFMVIVAIPTKAFGERRSVAGVAFEFAAFAACLAVFVLPALLDPDRGWSRRIFGSRVVLWLGQVSFGIYLYHDPILFELANAPIVTERSHPLLTFVVLSIAMTLAAAAMSYYALERPLLRLVGSRAARAGEPVAAPFRWPRINRRARA